MFDDGSIKRRAELENRKREMKEALDRINDEIRALDTEIVVSMIDSDLSSIKGNDYTFYLKNTIWASAADVDGLSPILESVGRGDLVKQTINGQALSAFVREIEGNDELIKAMEPAVDAGYIKITERVELGVRKI